MRKYVKTYESFRINRRFKFEEKVINPILELIRDNQVYLTELQNLPQLAKLGFMYNTLWYAGRFCWGNKGLLLDPEIKKAIKEYDNDDDNDENNPYRYVSCEDNPKYKIKMCDPQNEEIKDLIYDAWGMHLSLSEEMYDFNKFYNIVKHGIPLTELEKKELKINKTVEDWVEIKTDPSYRYRSIYPDRKSVLSHILCTIGNGYTWNREGFIIEEASGADQDRALYGDWQNAKLTGHIEEEVNRILSIIEVKETLNESYRYIKKAKEEEIEKEKNRWKDIMSKISGKVKDEDENGSEDDDEEIERIMNLVRSGNFGKKSEDPQIPKYVKYYPISKTSDIYAIIDKEIQVRKGISKFDQSYIDAAIEISQDILDHEDQELDANIEFARRCLHLFGIKDFSDIIPKEIDKYNLKKEIEYAFVHITDIFRKDDSNTMDLKQGEYRFHFNDSADSDYGNNSYVFYFSLKGFGLPKFYSKDIDSIKSIPIYDDLKSALSFCKELDGIKYVETYIDSDGSTQKLTIKFITDAKSVRHIKDQDKFENYLIENGFQIGSLSCALETKNYIFTCRKPSTLGTSHPDSKSIKDCFSNAHSFDVRDKSWRIICSLMIDERGFNVISNPKNSTGKEVDWVINEFNAMKASDAGYGQYGIKGREHKYEGKKMLYAHDFFLWLKEKDK